MLNIIQLPQRGYINNIVRSAMKLSHYHSEKRYESSAMHKEQHRIPSPERARACTVWSSRLRDRDGALTYKSRFNSL